MKNDKVSIEARGGRGGEGGGRGGQNMSTLIQILNLYATRDSQTKFEANCMKSSKVTVMRLEEEEEKRKRKYVNIDVLS